MATHLVDQQQLLSDVRTVRELLANPETAFGDIQTHILHTLGPCTIGDDLVGFAAQPEATDRQPAIDFFDTAARVIKVESCYGWISRLIASVSEPFQHSYQQQGPEAAKTKSLRIEIDDVCRMAAYVLLRYGHRTELNKELISQLLQSDHVHLLTVSLPKVCSDLGVTTFRPREMPHGPTTPHDTDPVHVQFTNTEPAAHDPAAPADSTPGEAERPIEPAKPLPVPWSDAAQQIVFELDMLEEISLTQDDPDAPIKQSVWQSADYRYRRLQRIAGPRLLGPGLAHALETCDDVSKAHALLADIRTIVATGGPLALAPALTEDAFNYMTALRVDIDGTQAEAARQWVRQSCADAAFVVLSWGNELHQTWQLTRHLLEGDVSAFSAAVQPLVETPVG